MFLVMGWDLVSHGNGQTPHLQISSNTVLEDIRRYLLSGPRQKTRYLQISVWCSRIRYLLAAAELRPAAPRVVNAARPFGDARRSALGGKVQVQPVSPVLEDICRYLLSGPRQKTRYLQVSVWCSPIREPDICRYWQFHL